MTGLPTGYRIRVAGELSPTAVSGDAVSIDLAGAALPAAQVEVLNRTSTVVKLVTPGDGVWGGDRYSLNGAP